MPLLHPAGAFQRSGGVLLCQRGWRWAGGPPRPMGAACPRPLPLPAPLPGGGAQHRTLSAAPAPPPGVPPPERHAIVTALSTKNQEEVSTRHMVQTSWLAVCWNRSSFSRFLCESAQPFFFPPLFLSLVHELSAVFTRLTCHLVASILSPDLSDVCPPVNNVFPIKYSLSLKWGSAATRWPRIQQRHILLPHLIPCCHPLLSSVVLMKAKDCAVWWWWWWLRRRRKRSRWCLLDSCPLLLAVTRQCWDWLPDLLHFEGCKSIESIVTQHGAGGGIWLRLKPDWCICSSFLQLYLWIVLITDDFTECFNGLMKINSNRFLFCCQRH